MMTSKKTKKGKKMPLGEFLASEPKVMTVRGSNWSEIVDQEEEESKPTFILNMDALPTAPRGAHDVDYSNVPNNPPFAAYVANLSFQVDDEGLRCIFADLNPKSARILRDGNRSRGIGIVEFDSRENLIEALKRTDKEVYGRTIRVNVSDKSDSHHNDGGRGGFGSRSNRNDGEERPEMRDKWKRAETRSDDNSDNRSGGGFNRDRIQRNDFPRQNMNRGPRDNTDGNDFGFGYPRARDDRGGGGNGGGRDYNNRPNQRNRYQDDDNRSNSGMDRPRYAGRYSDTRDVRDRNRPSEDSQDDRQDQTRERPRLQLQPRTKPLEALEPLSGSSSSVNNVAANVTDSPTSNSEETSQTPNRRTEDSFSNEHRDDNQHKDLNEGASGAGTSDDSSIPKPSRGAGASIFGGAKPVDTAAKELEIEKKLKELQMAKSDAGDDQEEKTNSSRPSFNRTGDRDRDRDNYRGKRSSHNDDYHNRDRDRHRRDDGRSDHGNDYHHRREHSGGRQYEDDHRRRNDDDQNRRGSDRERWGGPSRRDNDSGRSNKYQHQNTSERDNERGNFRQRDDRNQDSNESSNQGRPSNNTFSGESQSRNQQRGMNRRTVPPQDDSHRLQLFNKFDMLNDEGGDENDDVQSPSIDE